MSDKFEFARVTMPEFAMLLPETIYKEAIISLGILNKGIPCGVICASMHDYHYSLTWLYIDKKCRRKGYASALLTELLSIIREAGETYPMQLTFTSADEELLGFFQSYEHFYVSAVGEIMNVPAKNRNDGSTYKTLMEIDSKGCTSYYSFDNKIKDDFLKKLDRTYSQFAGLINSDLDVYEPELTLAYGKSEIKAAVFCKLIEGRIIDISFVYSEDVFALGVVLITLIKKIEKNYPDYGLRIICVNDKSRQLAYKLFPDILPDYLLEANWDLRLPGEYPAFN